MHTQIYVRTHTLVWNYWDHALVYIYCQGSSTSFSRDSREHLTHTRKYILLQHPCYVAKLLAPLVQLIYCELDPSSAGYCCLCQVTAADSLL